MVRFVGEGTPIFQKRRLPEAIQGVAAGPRQGSIGGHIPAGHSNPALGSVRDRASLELLVGWRNRR